MGFVKVKDENAELFPLDSPPLSCYLYGVLKRSTPWVVG